MKISIDLHGMTIEKGYNLALMHVKMHYLNGSKACRIITGRSGKMNREAKAWFENPSFKPYVKFAEQDWHKGSWTLELNRGKYG